MKKHLGFYGNKVDYFFVGLILCILVATSIYYYSSKSLHRSIEMSLVELAEQGAETVSRDIEKYYAILETLAKVDEIKNPSIPLEEKLYILNSSFISDGLLRISIADMNGYSKTTDGTELFVGDRNYFIRAKEGKRSVSDIIKSRVDGTYVLAFAVPVYNEDKIESVLYATYPAEELSLITDSIKFAGTGNSFIINNKGTVMAHEDRQLVYDGLNYLEEPHSNPNLTALIELMKEMVVGKSGTGEYFYDDTNKYMGFSPIRGTEWSFGVTAPRSIVFGDIDKFIYILVSVSVLVGALILILNIYLKFVKESLTKQKLLSQNAIDTAKIIRITFDFEGKIVDFNTYAVEQTGYTYEEVVSKKSIFDVVKDTDSSKVKYLMDNSISPEFKQNIEFAMLGKQRQEIYVLWNINISDQVRIKDNIEIMGIDITERVMTAKELQRQNDELNALYEELIASEEELKEQYDKLSYHQEKIRRSEERYELVVQASNIGIWDWDMITNERFYSDKWYEIFEINKDVYSKEEDIWIERIYPEDKEKALNMLNEHIEKRTDSYEGEYKIKTNDSNIRWVHAVGKALWDNTGNPYRMAGTFQDITEKKEYEEKIKQYAYYDGVTGLPNRIMFSNYFKEIAKSREKAILIYMDIDNFKFVNNSYGQNFGDLLLKEVGKKLESLCEYNYIVSRFNGDEYCILLLDVDDKDKAIEFCNLLMERLNETYDIDNIQLHISVSMGVSCYPENSSSFDELLKYADIAMDKAKEYGKNRYVFYTEDMKDELMEKLTIQNHLRKALANDEFVLYYQPQFDTIKKIITGFEALVRWNNPVLGIVSPAKFISVAEENRSIIPLGEWILKTACQFIKRLSDQHSREFIVSVNISIIQLIQDNFVETVLEILEETKLEPRLLELELTESILMESFDMVSEKLERLKKSGVRIALDDFGKGYSSLSYLRHLPISTLKIDKSFIDNIKAAIDGDTLTEAIICMGKKMGLLIVAEGVETDQQLEYLAREKCDRIQGYLLGKPMTDKNIYKLLSTEKKI